MMFRVLACLMVEHDWGLVLLAGALCLLSCLVVWSLFQRATVTSGGWQLLWFALSSIVAGSGIWATHFVAMLAYAPGSGIGYDLPETIASLVLSITLAALGLGLTLWGRGRFAAAAGGSIMGVGIAAMHFTGMAALEVSGRLSWSLDLVAASIVIAVVSGSLSHVAGKSRPGGVFAALLLTTAILGHHFTGMAAVEVIPDPAHSPPTLLLSPDTLALIVVSVMGSILGMPFVAVLSDRRSADKNLRQKCQLDAAMQNMRQGLCMFDVHGRIVLFNERYASMMELPSAPASGPFHVLCHPRFPC